MPLFFFLINKNPLKGGYKNKNMETEKCKCPECEKRAEEMRQSEEIAFAFLLALMPLMTITLFSNFGLF